MGMFAPELVHRGPEMRIMVGLCLLGFIFCTLSFWSDNWWYTFNPKNTFLRCGPWFFCFKGYIYPRDYRGKIYNGCWYVFVKEYRWLLDLLVPSWFIAFQTFEIIACICNGIAMMIVLFTFWRPYSVTSCYRRMQRAFAFKAAEAVSQGIAIIIFGDGATSDWQWMPLRMDNMLGWGFGLAVISNVAAVACLLPMSLYGFRLRTRIQQFYRDDDFEGVQVSQSSLPHSAIALPEAKPLRSAAVDDDDDDALPDNDSD